MPLTFDQVHQKYGLYIRNLIRPRVLTRDLDDVVQMCRFQINHALPGYDPARRIEPWLATIVLRTVEAYRRRVVLRIRSEHIFFAEAPSAVPSSEARTVARELLAKLLACLSQRQLEMVLRHLADEEPLDAISRDLGIDREVGYKVFQTALAKLKAERARLEAIERRQLRERGALLVPFWLSFRVQAWVARARALLLRSFQWAKLTPTSIAAGTTLMVVLGAVPPQPRQVTHERPAAPVISIAMADTPATKTAIDPPMPVIHAAAQPLSGGKRAAAPAINEAAEGASLKIIQATLATDAIAALSALERHKRAFPRDRLRVEREAIQALARAALERAHEERTP